MSVFSVVTQFAKRCIERAFHCRIYRTSLPRGTDLYDDLKRDFGLDYFRCVFDIGANIGQSTAVFSTEFASGKIYSFEPVPKTYESLLLNTRGDARIKTFNLGFGSSDHSAAIHVGSDSKVSSIKFQREGDQKSNIEVRSLASFCAEHGVDRIHFAKIDTEGYELEVLQGAEPLLKEQRIDALYIETCPNLGSDYFVPINKLLEKFSGFGYELYGLYEQQPHWGGRKSLLYFNALFVSRRMLDQEEKIMPDMADVILGHLS